MKDLKEKYFAWDGDKFLFWIENEGIKFRKIGFVLSKLSQKEAEKIYESEIKKLPILSWDSINYKSN